MCTRRLWGVPSALASRMSASSVLWPAAGKITSRTTPSGLPTAASATRWSVASSCAARAERRRRSSRYAPGRPTRSRANQPLSSLSSTGGAGSRDSRSSESQLRNFASVASSNAAIARWSRTRRRCRRPVRHQKEICAASPGLPESGKPDSNAKSSAPSVQMLAKLLRRPQSLHPSHLVLGQAGYEPEPDPVTPQPSPHYVAARNMLNSGAFVTARSKLR